MLNPIAGEHMTRALEEQIAGMQAELAAAHVAIHRSEGRLSDTVQNLSELEASVQRAFGASGASSSSTAAAAAVVGPATPEAAPQQKQQQVVQQQQRRAPATQRPAAPVQRSGRRSGSGLASSLAIPELLKDYWFPAEFSASLTEGKMVPFELFNEVGGRYTRYRGISGGGREASAGAPHVPRLAAAAAPVPAGRCNFHHP